MSRNGGGAPGGGIEKDAMLSSFANKNASFLAKVPHQQSTLHKI